MALGLTLSQIKAAIVNNSKQVEICQSLQEANIAATEDDLITAGIALAVWVYQTGVVDDNLLDEFTEAKLNAQGVYTSGTFSIADPVSEVFIMKNAVVTVALSGNAKAKINVMGNSTAIINAGNNAFSEIKNYNTATLNLILNDQAMCILTALDESSVAVVENDDSILHLVGNSAGNVELIENDQAFARAKMYNSSSLTYTLNGISSIDAVKFQNATITNNSIS